MPVDPRQREQRLDAIRNIIAAHSVRSQEELVRRLTALGLSVTQSSVSRDLRSLPISKVGGAYRLTPPAGGPTNGAALQETIRDAVTGISSAGPNLVVLHTVIGAASRVGSIIDGAAWPEIVGTVAGDDTLFVAVGGPRAATGLRRRIGELVGKESNDG